MRPKVVLSVKFVMNHANADDAAESILRSKDKEAQYLFFIFMEFPFPFCRCSRRLGASSLPFPPTCQFLSYVEDMRY